MQTRHWSLESRICCVTAMVFFSVSGTQDRRTITEPVIPPVCSSVIATKDWPGRPSAADENKLDTQQIQAAIDTCGSGRAVELKAGSNKNAFLVGPLQLRTEVTLVIDKELSWWLRAILKSSTLRGQVRVGPNKELYRV
jgi:polygalacturonase